jgi:hypothetical protein
MQESWKFCGCGGYKKEVKLVEDYCQEYMIHCAFIPLIINKRPTYRYRLNSFIGRDIYFMLLQLSSC